MSFVRKGKRPEYRVAHIKKCRRAEKMARWQEKGIKFAWTLMVALLVDSVLAFFMGQKLFHQPFIFPFILGNLAIFGWFLSPKDMSKEAEKARETDYGIWISAIEMLPPALVVAFVGGLLTVVLATVAGMFFGDDGWDTMFKIYYWLISIGYFLAVLVRYWTNSMPNLAKPIKKS